MRRVRVVWRHPRRLGAVGLLREIAAFVARHAADAWNIVITVVDSREMAALHRRFHADPSPTDILTFDLRDDPRSDAIDAELVISADAAIEANPRAAPAELALYVTHGLLHLAGYDDHTPADARRMHAREDELLTEFGLGPVYSSPRGGAGLPASG